MVLVVLTAVVVLGLGGAAASGARTSAWRRSSWGWPWPRWSPSTNGDTPSEPGRRGCPPRLARCPRTDLAALGVPRVGVRRPVPGRDRAVHQGCGRRRQGPSRHDRATSGGWFLVLSDRWRRRGGTEGRDVPAPVARGRTSGAGASGSASSRGGTQRARPAAATGSGRSGGVPARPGAARGRPAPPARDRGAGKRRRVREDRAHPGRGRAPAGDARPPPAAPGPVPGLGRRAAATGTP